MFMYDNCIKLNIYLWPYEHETNIKQLQKYDNYLKRDIDDLQAAIKQIEEHRKKLFLHTQKLTSSQFSLKLSLIRRRDYTGKVFYYIALSKVFSEIGEQKIIDETYPGTERHNAIKRFEDLKKQYPGAEHIKEIEKARWER